MKAIKLIIALLIVSALANAQTVRQEFLYIKTKSTIENNETKILKKDQFRFRENKSIEYHKSYSPENTQVIFSDYNHNNKCISIKEAWSTSTSGNDFNWKKTKDYQFNSNNQETYFISKERATCEGSTYLRKTKEITNTYTDNKLTNKNIKNFECNELFGWSDISYTYPDNNKPDNCIEINEYGGVLSDNQDIEGKKRYYEFENGALIRISEYNKINNIYTLYKLTQYTYTEFNLLKKKEVFLYNNSESNLVSKDEYAYNDNGDITDFYTLSTHTAYTYNNNYQLTDKTYEVLNAQNTYDVETKETYEYNSNNLLTQYTSYDYNANTQDNLKFRVSHEYDINNNPTTSLVYETIDDIYRLSRSIVREFDTISIDSIVYAKGVFDEGFPITYTNKILNKADIYYDNSGNEIEEINYNYSYLFNYFQTDIPENNHEINLFPNPTNNVLNIECKSHKQPLRVELYSTTGVLVKSLVFLDNVHMNISDLSAGNYICKILDKNTVIKTESIIKTN